VRAAQRRTLGRRGAAARRSPFSAAARAPRPITRPPARSFLVVSHFTHYDKVHLWVNVPILLTLLIAKLPEMHGVRIFGINRGIIDEEPRDAGSARDD